MIRNQENMYFQVNISPVEKNKPKKQNENEIAEEIAILSLAPFTRKPTICFNNIQVNTVGTRKLIIKNPTRQDVKLYVTRLPPDERSLLLSWHQHTIPSEDEVLLELLWSPNVEGGWSDTITFEDGHRVKKDVLVTFKSFQPKKVKNKPSRSAQPVIKKKLKSPLKRKSPKKSLSKLTNRSPMQMSRFVFPDITNISSLKFVSPKSRNVNSEIEEETRRGTYSVKDKENFNISAFQSACSDDAFSPHVSSTFTIDTQEGVQEDIAPQEVKTRSNIINLSANSTGQFDDSLEMVSPNINRIVNRSQKGDNNHSPYSAMQDILKPVVSSPNCVTPTVFTNPQFLNDDNMNLLKSVSPSYSFDTPLKECTYTKQNISADRCVSPNVSSSTFIKDEFLQSNDENNCSPQVYNSATMGIPFQSPSSSVFNKEINLSQAISNSTVNRVNDLRGEHAKNILEANLWCGYDKPVLEKIIEESYFSDGEISTSYRKRKSDSLLKVCQPKRLILEPFLKPNVRSTPSPRKFLKKVTTSNLKVFVNKSKSNDTLERIEEKPVTLHDPDSFIANINNPFILTATNSIDPFMSTMYWNPKWVKEQEIKFTNWLNALLTPPIDLNSNSDGHPIDVAKLWQQCKRQEMSKAPTKETVSNKYHTSRIDSLRRSSIQLFRSEAISQILSKAWMMVENEKLVLRKDKNVHLDIGLQAEVMELFLSYNPLWLRIGLETIYGTTIPLHSNSDIIGLSLFISENFFKDSNLLKKYKTVHSPKYAVNIKKKVLQKFLMLVYFLDQAKLKQLISHDPCLFCKNAPIKDSREILLKFSAELISAIGDVTKYLKRIGYTLSHKQTYINEFDYAVTDLGSDLKDGVRLTRVAEIILLVNGLVGGLRVPAISRLQKVHNVKIVFDALHKAGFEILYDIEPKDIVEGHKEKTLSFLWQIIFKFQAPRLTKGAITIQAWWRSMAIVIKRRILTREHQIRESAATKIQKWFKRMVTIAALEKFILLLRQYQEIQHIVKAAVKIQSYVRMNLQQKKYLQIQRTTLKMQCYARRYVVMKKIVTKVTSVIKIQAFARMYLARSKYLKIKSAVLKIEEVYAATKNMSYQRDKYHQLKSSVLFMQDKFRANRQMKMDRLNYLKLKASVVVIQQKYKATCAMNKQRNSFLNMKQAAIFIQNIFRANVLMKNDRCHYLEMKRAALVLQKYYRANKLAQRERSNYLKLKNAILIITNRYLANKTMIREREYYLNLKSTVIYVQHKFRANKVMHQQQRQYHNLKFAVLCVQRKYRAIILMRKLREQYQQVRNSVIILQRRYRAKKIMEKQHDYYSRIRQAAIVIQSWHLANKAMKTQRRHYDNLKSAVLYIQTKYRANIIMRVDRNSYRNLKLTTIWIQSKFRANVLMREQRNRYKHLRNSVINVQRRYRAKKLMQMERIKYLKLRNSAIILQRQYKAKKTMEEQRTYYYKLRRAVFTVENRYLANKAMKTQHQYYENLKSAAIYIQAKHRANISMRIDRNSYRNLKLTTILIQSKFRANVSMREQQYRYKHLRNSVINVQRRYRAMKLMQMERIKYLKLRNSAIILQRQYKAKKSMEEQRNYYYRLRHAVFTVENRYLANKAMKTQRQYYENLKSAAVYVQTKHRANITMRADRNSYRNLKLTTIWIQSNFRANVLMREQRDQYKHLRNSVINVQRRYRAMKLMHVERSKYLKLRNSAIILQRQYKAKKIMEEHRNYYYRLRRAVIAIENRYLANKAMRTQHLYYENLKYAVLYVQKKYRANIRMRVDRNTYSNLKLATILIQSYFRANILMRHQQEQYKHLRNCVIKMQRRYRATKLSQMERIKYIKLRNSTLIVQRQYRANKLMLRQRNDYKNLRDATILIQIRYRATLLMKIQSNYYQKLKLSALVIQKRFRANKSIHESKLQTLVVVQSYVRSYLVRKQYEPILQEKRRVRNLKNSAATKIKAVWKGYQVRSKCAEKITQIRLNVQRANDCALVENTLGYLRNQSLRVLCGENSTMIQINRSLKDLDFISRRCKKTCKSMSEILPEQLYKIIIGTSRSLPEIEASMLATSILINFCKYSLTTVNCWYPNYVDKLFTVMMHCCDKEDSLFLNVCTLLWLFAHNEQYKVTIQSIPNLQQRLEKVKQLSLRKQRIVARSIKHNSIFATYTNLPLPSLVPDWGIDYKNAPKTFQNAVHSLNSLCEILDVK